MVEVTQARCFVLWTEDKQGRQRFDPTVFSSAHAVIREGERQQEKGMIKDYNYSVVFCPQIGGEQPKIKLLTEGRESHSVEL